MKTISIRWLGALLLAGLTVVAPGVRAQAQPKIVTLGADLTPPQREALLGRFGASEGTDKILTITTPEMTELMQNIIPVPESYTSVSSTSLTCGQPGSGLRVTTENITRVTAGMFAGAALTAGIGDAELVVAAPADAAAEGMTAITGIFKGFQGGACERGELEPARRELALRWLAVTNELGGALGDQNAAARLMLSAHQGLISGGKGDPAAVEPALDGAIKDTGTNLTAEQRPAVVDLLRRMADAKIDWGKYASGWNLEQVSPTEVRLTPAGVQPGADTGAPAAAAGAAGAAGSPATLSGTVATAPGAGTSLAVDVGGQSRQLDANAPNIAVTRDGQPAQLADIQAGDTVTVQLGADNVVQKIDARSAAAGNNAGAGASGRFVVGTVNENNQGQLTLQTAGGTQQFSVPGSAYVAREGRQAQVGAVQAQDSAVVVLDPAGTVQSVFARPGGSESAIEGTAESAANGQTVRVRAGSQTVEVPVAGNGIAVTRDARQAGLADIQPNDQVTVRFNPAGQPVAVDARSTRRAGLLANPWLLSLCLLPLLALLPLFWRRRRPDRTILVEPGRRREVDTDEVDKLKRG